MCIRDRYSIICFGNLYNVLGDEILKKLLISLLIGVSIIGVSCGKEEIKSDNSAEAKQESVAKK